MIDLKLMLFNEINLLVKINAYAPVLWLNGLELSVFNELFFTNFKFTSNSTFFFACKFLLAIGFLILIRGGAPRYRYDYLTKLGWLKFLNFIILIFFLTILFIFLQ